MQQFLLSLTPPLVGAFIGYMTNYIAIRMLFRPLTPWKIFGIRVPLTPGVIPSRRKQLAVNIGEMVGEHLLTSRDVQQALADTTFRKDFANLLEERLNSLLRRDLGPLPSLVPERFRSYFLAGIKVVRMRMLHFLHQHLEDESFLHALKPAIVAALDGFTGKTLGALLSETDQRQMTRFSEQAIARFLERQEIEDWLKRELHIKIEAVLTSDASLRDLLSDQTTDALLDSLAAETPALLKKLATLLREPGMQDKICDGISRLAKTITDSLGPMAALIGSFLSPETIKGHVKKYLDNHGDEIATWLFDQAVQDRVAGAVRERAESWMHKPLRELVGGIAYTKISQTEDRIAAFLLFLIRQPATATHLAALVGEHLKGQRSRSLSDILSDIFGVSGMHKGKQWLAGEMATAVRSPKSRRFIDEVVVELVEKRLLTRPIGTLADLLPKEVQRGISEYLFQQILDILVREVPGLVDSLNIRRIVARKVNSLDLLRLEGLLLSIMQEQFTYINLFGALIGFLIGLVNLLLLPI